MMPVQQLDIALRNNNNYLIYNKLLDWPNFVQFNKNVIKTAIKQR